MATTWPTPGSRLPQLLGFPLTLACPQGYDPDPGVLARACERADAPITLLRDPVQAISGADVINVDVWASMGQESEQTERLSVFRP